MNKIRLIGCAIITWTICVFFITGIFYNHFWSVPENQAKIISLKARLSECQNKNQTLKVAMNFEKLFLLLCKPDTITLLGDLEERINDKAEFCLEAAG